MLISPSSLNYTLFWSTSYARPFLSQCVQPATKLETKENHEASTLENVHLVQSEKSNKLTLCPVRGWYCTHPHPYSLSLVVYELVCCARWNTEAVIPLVLVHWAGQHVNGWGGSDTALGYADRGPALTHTHTLNTNWPTKMETRDVVGGLETLASGPDTMALSVSIIQRYHHGHTFISCPHCRLKITESGDKTVTCTLTDTVGTLVNHGWCSYAHFDFWTSKTAHVKQFTCTAIFRYKLD